MADCGIYFESDESVGSQRFWAVRYNGNVALIVFLTILSVEVGQITSHAPDSLMRSICFYASSKL